MIKYFVQIIIQSKGLDDWRAFLIYQDITKGYKGVVTNYEIRGYGATAEDAVKDVWMKYEDNEYCKLFSNEVPNES